MEIRQFIDILFDFQSSLTPFKAMVLNPDPHGEEARKSMRLIHLGHKLSILATLRECAETAWRHFWESTAKAMNVFQIINYETLLDHESNTLEFCKHMMLHELKRFQVTDNICVGKVKQLDDETSSLIKTMGYCDPTDLSLYFENFTQTELNMIGQTARSSHSNLEHSNQSDRDTCCQTFVDVSTIVQNGKLKCLITHVPAQSWRLSLSIKALMCLKMTPRLFQTPALRLQPCFLIALK